VLSVKRLIREMLPIARDYKIQKMVDLTLISEWGGKAFLEIISFLLLLALVVILLPTHFNLHALTWQTYYSMLYIYVYSHGSYLNFPF